MRMARGCLTPMMLLLALFVASSFIFVILQLNPFSPAVLLVVVPAFLVFAGIFFFRDPEIDIGRGIISPADGVVSRLTGGVEGDTIAIFMNVHNIHVNRVPVSGRIERMSYKPGAHLPAYRKDSDRNERFTTVIRGSEGNVKIVQIAGTLARRIVPYRKEGDQVSKGDRMGLIRFGSRVDITLPLGAVSTVSVGQRIRVGETIANPSDEKNIGGS